jgi:hypothetical protein
MRLFPKTIHVNATLSKHQKLRKLIEIPIIRIWSTSSRWTTPAKESDQNVIQWISTLSASLPTHIMKSTLRQASKRYLIRL